VNFRRLTPGHALALIAALLLLLAMAPDWWTDKVGELRRDNQEKVLPSLDREVQPSLSDQAGDAAEQREKNAWQASAAIDRVILILLLATAGLAIAAAFRRAAGRPPGTPSLSGLATVTGLAAALMIAYRILQPPGLNEAAVVKWGAPAGLVCVALVALGSRIATLEERKAPAEEESPSEEQVDADLESPA
jgi:hypothetical protein